jgi:iron complex transport system substrate-binding protein
MSTEGTGRSEFTTKERGQRRRTESSGSVFYKSATDNRDEHGFGSVSRPAGAWPGPRLSVAKSTHQSPVWVLIVTLLLFALPGASFGGVAQGVQPPRRIISLIPAVTEMLFAIGAGPQVVAVSSFDRYPPQVEKLQRVGALIDPDVERILSLRPDLVAIYASQADLRAQLERAKVPIYVYSHAALADITTTMKALGERVGHGREAADLARTIDTRIDAIRKRVAGRPRPRTLIVFDRESLALRGIYASGGFGFIHDMVDAAGGENVFADVKQQAVQATTELILSRRPEVILELRGDSVSADLRRREIAVWQALSSVPAVRDGRVYFIDQQLTVIPGPRVAEAIDLIARTLHPEAYK